MEKKTISLKELKKRKMLLVLPILALPFITMLFWSLGGGKNTISDIIVDKKKGFNSDLPNPKFKEDSTFDKMSYYDQAAVDSIKLLEQIKKDPNYSNEVFLEDSLQIRESKFGDQSFRSNKIGSLNTVSYQDANEQIVYKKLKVLQQALNKPVSVTDKDQDLREFQNYGATDEESPEIKNLENIMSAMNETPEPDPELKQLGGMLENILDIQHPERMQEKLRQSLESKKANSHKVDLKTKENNITSLGQFTAEQKNTSNLNAFYSLDETDILNNQQNSIEAVIHETQTIVDGSTIKLRLTNDVFINGILIPKNSFLFGIAALKGERLEVKINNVKYGSSIYPVDLSVYDIDGINGIYIPGTINRDVAKESAERSIQTLGLASLNDSWGAKAAGMGVEAAKSLMSKKVKLIKVVVKAGYQVLLYDEKQKNSK
ncbi:conjugative transposon protein TraM [Flavobacterium fluviatile]|uniref:conjugative transposon protein TraM n=1 Tax=Flavobacterium fluviatile TaxID=1862387 RepID=UPI0013D70959|nr:conjugative transposon protein TraM [Flavobacterium fluviatile]